MKTMIFTLCLSLLSMTAVAQRTITICGEYTYYPSENITLERAKQEALKLAKTTALAKKFGTVVSQSSSSFKTEESGRLSDKYVSFSEDEVKGEWLADTKDPEYEVSYKNDMLVVKVSVCGKAREIVRSKVTLSVKLLRNGFDAKHESDMFRDGDAFYLMFQSPQRGYVAVYLVDDVPNAYCLLPYRNNKDGWVSVENNKDYIFFSENHAGSPDEGVEELAMTCAKDVEYNQLYVIFSPNQFIKANDDLVSEDMPRELSFDDFRKWLSDIRMKDKDMVVVTKELVIRK